MAGCSMLVQVVLAVFLMICIPPLDAVDINFENAGYVTKDRGFYVESANYTVHEEGIVTISELNITDSWFLLYTRPSNTTPQEEDSRYSGRRKRMTVCALSLGDISREDIIKVYDETTDIKKGDEPDTFTIPGGRILCISHIVGSVFPYNYTYSYKDGQTTVDNVTRIAERSRQRLVYFMVPREYKERCVQSRGGENIAFEIIGEMKDKKSLSSVIVEYETVFARNWPRSRDEDSNRRMINLTPRTPYNQSGPYTFPWDYTRRPAKVCFKFRVVNTTFDFNEDIFFRATAYSKCDGRMTDVNGLFTSGAYPRSSVQDSNCTQSIVAKPGQRLSLTFLDARFDCKDSFVLLRGVEGDGKRLLCGDSVNGSSFLSDSNELNVTMVTKGYDKDRKGYLATYKAVGCAIENARLPSNAEILGKAGVFMPGSQMTVRCERGYIFPDMTSQMTLRCRKNNTWSAQVPPCVQYSPCNKNMTSVTEGTIESPGYPDSLPRGIQCRWTLNARPGQYIKATIQDLSAVCTDNFLAIESVVNGTEMEQYGRTLTFCDAAANGVKGKTFTTKTHVMRLMFGSGHEKSSGSVKVSYQALGCAIDEGKMKEYLLLSTIMPRSNQVRYHMAGTTVKYLCPRGPGGWQMEFATGERQRTATCGEDGTWKDTFPLCVPRLR